MSPPYNIDGCGTLKALLEASSSRYCFILSLNIIKELKEFYYKEIPFYDNFGPVCPSIKDHLYKKPNYNIVGGHCGIVTLGQMHHLMEEGWSGWYSEYFKRRK